MIRLRLASWRHGLVALKAGLGALIVGAGLLVPSVASADVLGTVSAGALVGNGFKDGLNLGVGVRAGYTFPFQLYLGGTFVYHLGESESVAGYETSTKVYYYGVEGGYDIDVGPLTIRPYLGIGRATASVKLPTVCPTPGACFGGDASAHELGFWPGAAGIFSLGTFFVGADARFLIVNDFNAPSLFATAGFQI